MKLHSSFQPRMLSRSSSLRPRGAALRGLRCPRDGIITSSTTTLEKPRGRKPEGSEITFVTHCQ